MESGLEEGSLKVLRKNSSVKFAATTGKPPLGKGDQLAATKKIIGSGAQAAMKKERERKDLMEKLLLE